MAVTETTSTFADGTTRLRRLTAAILAWAILYGALRIYWAAGNAPRFSPVSSDLLLYSPWMIVGLCAAAGLAAVALRVTAGRVEVVVLSWCVVAAMLIGCPLFLLDIVGGLLAGLGIPFDLASFGGRLGMMTGVALLAWASLTYQRQRRGACQRCGRTTAGERPVGTPVWAWWAAYLAVAGCLVRIGAQLVVGFDAFLYEAGVALVVFEAGFLLAGCLLPLALVHRFGRIWPAWVLPLAGRRVPRWLVLGPGLVLGFMLTLYFGFGLAQMTVELVSGTAVYGDGVGSAGFLWTAIPAYLLWGVGLAVGAVGRFLTSRPVCRRCAR